MKMVDTDDFIVLRHDKCDPITMKAKFLFDIICYCAWSCGCPGIIFFDRVNKDNKFYPEMVIDTTNPMF